MTTGEHSVDELECLAGRVLDRRYLLDRYIARGAFGVVYRGIDQKFNSPVAVKIGRSYREFTKEARLAAEVRHPHIVQVTDYGLDGGFAYLVMEFLEGDDLEKLMLRPDHPVNAALLKKLVAEVGDALSHAHGVNLVHRDLKPRNIILKNSSGHANDSESPGRFVLVDFGIAAKLDAQGTQRNATFDGAGTAEYMAPELLRASPVATPRSDIYAFGTIMYQLMTGRVPFPQCDGSHLALADCLNAIANDPAPEFSTVIPNRHYPVELEALVLQCLEKDPAQRPQSIEEVRERFLAYYYPEMGTGDFSQTLRPGGFVETKRIRGKTGRIAPVPAPSRWTSNAVAMIAFGVCLFTLAITLRRNQPEPHRPPETRPLPLAAAPPIQESSSVTTAEEVQPVPQYTVGGTLEPADARLTANGTLVETKDGRWTWKSSDPEPVTLLAKREGYNDWKQTLPTGEGSTIAIELQALPAVQFEGTLDPADAALTINGLAVDVRQGQWKWSSQLPVAVSLQARRVGFADWNREISQPGRQTVAVVLEQLARLRLSGTLDPPEAMLEANGTPIPAPGGRWQWTGKDAIAVTLSARREGFLPWNQTFTDPGEHRVPISLSPVPNYRLSGSVDPADAEVTINGESVAVVAGAWNWQTTASGTVMLKARRAQFADIDRPIEVMQNGIHQLVLDPILTVTPFNATVTESGRPLTVDSGKVTIPIAPDASVTVVATLNQDSTTFTLTRDRVRDLNHHLLVNVSPPAVTPQPLTTPALDLKTLSTTSLQLQSELNALCVDVWKTYHDDTEEFYGSYRELFELLQISKKMNASLAKGGRPASLKAQLLTIGAEVPHTKHHLKEFGERPGISEATRQRLSEKFEKVEATHASLITSLDQISDVEQAPESQQEVNWAAIRPTVGAVHNRAKSVCTSLFRVYRSNTEEFQECYKDATEVRLLAEKLDGDAGQGTSAENLSEHLSQITDLIQQLKSDVPALAKSDGSAESVPFKSIMIMIRHIESDVNKLLVAVGNEDLHGDAEQGEKAVADKARNSTPAELAGELRDLAISLANSLDDDSRKHPAFRKAYIETLEFQEICEDVKKGLVGDPLNREARDLLASLDGEIHQIEEHINGFQSDSPGVKEARSRAKRKMQEIKLAAHALMKQVGIKKTNVD